MDGNAGDAGNAAAELFNRQVDQRKLEALGERVAALQGENESLRARHAAREQETHEFVAYFQKEIQARDRAVGRLGEELAAAKAALASGLEAARRARESEAAVAAREAAAREERLSAQLAGAREELQQLEAFRDVREATVAAQRALAAQLASEQAGAREALAALERKFIEERARLLREHEARIEAAQRQAREDARNGLDADTRKIATDNRRMGEELRFQLQASEELQREQQALRARAARLHLDLQVALAKEGEYARQARRQARELEQLRSDLRDAETRASAGRSAAERAADAQQARGQREREDLQLDADALRRLLRLKNKELRSLRRLAQAVLDQRSDVEQFFLDALAHVRREAEAERAARARRERERDQADARRAIGLPAAAPSAARSGARPEVKFPQLAGAGAAADGRVDLRQLGWEDKERVLRLVFARINGAQGAADAVGSGGGRGAEAEDEEDGGEDKDGGEAAEGGNNGAKCRPQVVYFATEAADPADGEAWRAGGPSEASMSLTGLPLVPRAPLKPARPAR